MARGHTRCPRRNRLHPRHLRVRVSAPRTGAEPLAAHARILDRAHGISRRSCLMARQLPRAVLLLPMARYSHPLFLVAHHMSAHRMDIPPSWAMGDALAARSPRPPGMFHTNRLLALLTETARTPLRSHRGRAVRHAHARRSAHYRHHTPCQGDLLGGPRMDGRRLHRGLSLLRSLGAGSYGAVKSAAALRYHQLF